MDRRQPEQSNEDQRSSRQEDISDLDYKAFRHEQSPCRRNRNSPAVTDRHGAEGTMMPAADLPSASDRLMTMIQTTEINLIKNARKN
jgi:hypothetical protein